MFDLDSTRRMMFGDIEETDEVADNIIKEDNDCFEDLLCDVFPTEDDDIRNNYDERTVLVRITKKLNN